MTQPLYYGDDASVSIVTEKVAVTPTNAPAGNLAGRKAESWTEQLSDWASENQEEIIKALLIAGLIVCGAAFFGGFIAMPALEASLRTVVDGVTYIGNGSALGFGISMSGLIFGILFAYKLNEMYEPKS